MIPIMKSEPKHLTIGATSPSRKSNKNSKKKTRKSLEPQEGNRRNHGVEKWEAVWMDGLPRNPRTIYGVPPS
jgi:hypothetical protein